MLFYACDNRVARKTTRKTRSTRTKNGERETSSFALDTAQKIKKRVGNVFQPLEKKLAQSEVDFDLRELNGVFESSKKRRMEAAGTSPNAAIESDNLRPRSAVIVLTVYVCVGF